MTATQLSTSLTSYSVTSCFSHSEEKKSMSKTIWVLIELENGKPANSSLEVLGKVANMGRAEAIVLGAAAADIAPTLGEYGAEKVYAHADAAYDTYLTLPAVETLSNLLKQH